MTLRHGVTAHAPTSGRAHDLTPPAQLREGGGPIGVIGPVIGGIVDQKNARPIPDEEWDALVRAGYARAFAFCMRPRGYVNEAMEAADNPPPDPLSNRR